MKNKFLESVICAVLMVSLSTVNFNVSYAGAPDTSTSSEQVIEENCLASLLPESFSHEVFSFNKTTDAEYLELAEFLKGKDMMKYFYGIPFSFENKEDALLYGLERNPDGSAISKTGKEAITYTIRCAEQGNSIIGQVSFAYPKTGIGTTYGDHGEVLKKVKRATTNVSYIIGEDFQGHSYAFRAIKAFIDEFYKLNEKSELKVTFKFECNPENVASLKTIEKLGALPLPDCTEKYRYYKKSVNDNMCEVKIEQFQNKKLCDVTTQRFHKKILHKSLLDLKEGECVAIKEIKFYYDR